jgi:DNA-directed RNA polymerase specialized sigma24 family protein
VQSWHNEHAGWNLAPGSDDDVSGRISEAVDLWAGFARLRRDEQELLYLRYVDEMPMEELVELLGASRNTVEQRLVRARDKLRRGTEVGMGLTLRRRWLARRRDDHGGR